jgi:Ca2+-binding EF-hand superfamily protein
MEKEVVFNKRHLKTVFEALDTDTSGTLNKAEITYVFRGGSNPKTEQFYHKINEELDAN